MVFDMPSCGGCRTCEIACSFHHRADFVPAVSSLKVLEKSGGAGYVVLLRESADGLGMACDFCSGEEVPWCVRYCRESDDLLNILAQFQAYAAKPGTANQQGVQRDQQ